MNTHQNKNSLARMSKFFTSEIHNQNVKRAIKKVREQGRLVWISEFDESLAEFKNLLENALERLKIINKILGDNEAKFRNTDEFIPSPHTASSKLAEKTSIKDWAFKDIALLLLTVGGAIGCAILGKNNLEANLLSSGNILFVERPDMAKSLSWILPLSALALKFVTNTLDNDRFKLHYTRLINSILLILVLLWSWLFAQNFPGVTAEIDLSGLLNGDGNGPWLVWSQLLIELLSGTALFLAAERVYLKYSGDHYWNNPLHPELKKTVKENKAEYKVATAEISKLAGKIVAMEADRDAFVNQVESEFISYRARFKSAQDPNLS